MRFNEAEVRVSDAHANHLRLLDRFLTSVRLHRRAD
jgi:hypothetical protein